MAEVDQITPYPGTHTISECLRTALSRRLIADTSSVSLAGTGGDANPHATSTMTHVHTPTPYGKQSILIPVLLGLAVGLVQAGSPLAARWLDAATVYALELALIAAVYIGFAVPDGRPRVIVAPVLRRRRLAHRRHSGNCNHRWASVSLAIASQAERRDSCCALLRRPSRTLQLPA